MSKNDMYRSLGIQSNVIEYLKNVEEEISNEFEAIDDIASFNQLKVLNAMQNARLANNHFNWNTGYGYDDPGREKIEEIYSDIFKTEDAITIAIRNGFNHSNIFFIHTSVDII